MALAGQEKTNGKKAAQARRRFLGDVARGACAVAALGVPLAFLAQRSMARPAEAIRPPGALEEEAFLSACVRCGLCVRDCPYDTLRLAQPDDPLPPGTPYFLARDIPCEMCEDIPCVAACPTGALDHELTNIDDARMGSAVLLDHETCLNYQGLRCDVCYRVCPLIDEAIILERQVNTRTNVHALFIPVVNTDKCTGCGKCEQACVLEEAAIKVLPTYIATGELGAHYRWGWVEKEEAGRSLLPGETIDLPDRMPDFPTLPPTGGN